MAIWGTTGVYGKMDSKAQMEESMALLPFLSATIEQDRALNDKDIERYKHFLANKKAQRIEMKDAFLVGSKKAAKVLKPGVTFNTFVAKSIVLSGKKKMIDDYAKENAYEDGTDQIVTSTRITRAVVSIEMEKKYAAMPKEQREMAKQMMASMLGVASAEDLKVVKPYALEIFEKMKSAGELQ